MRRTKVVSITALLGATVLALTACSAGSATEASGAASSAAADSGPAETVFKLGLKADLPEAPQARAHTPPPPRDARAIEKSMDDLLVFLTSERCAKLRKQLGVAVG